MKIFAVVFFLMLVPFSGAHAACQDCRGDIALFVSSKSVWQTEVEALHRFFKAQDLTVLEVTAAQINLGVLGSSGSRNFTTLVMPGGLVGARSHEFDEIGRSSIRQFITSGGGYVGICAGAAFAACGFRVALSSDATPEHHEANEYVKIPYHLLELWPGSAQSPYEWAPYQRGGTVEEVELTGTSTKTKMYYHAGPALFEDHAVEGKTEARGLEVWARVSAPTVNVKRATLSAAQSAIGKPSIVKFNYGAGRVVLFSQHPVISVDPVSDRINQSLLRRAFSVQSCESLFK